MKRTVFFLYAITVSAAFADSASISDVTVRQLWPWSGDVEIAFTVSNAATPVKFTAKYDDVEPFVLAEKDLSGDFFEAKVGRRHVRWSPKSAGLDADSLINFRIVSAEPDVGSGSRTYLVLDLKTGDYAYTDTVPDGGWIFDQSYCQTKMVFRRIPAGSATLGLPLALRTLSGAAEAHCYEHNVEVSSDYYMAVFPVTRAQHQLVVGGENNVSGYGISVQLTAYSYDALRGTVEDDGVDWPNTGYNVASNSFVAAFRNAAKIPSEWVIDLPTAVQWEYAARATTPSDQLWSVGGKDGDTLETLYACLDQIATWQNNYTLYGETKIGQYKPNGWGIYDMVGLTYEWNLDWYGNATTYYSGKDPVGPFSGTWRARRSANYSYDAASKGLQYLTTAAIGRNGSTSTHNYRLCIHMKRLVK